MKRSDYPEKMSVYEASDFWDEHGFDEFEDVREEKGVKFLLRKKKYVGIDMDLYSRIRSKAKILGKAEDTLISEWLSEKAGSIS
ncbi:MAG: CopG family antitoxin [Thermodesulfobacteriota bacterium]